MSTALHIVQLANFYGPGSGGLRTAVDRLAAGYVEHGHRVTTIVPSRTDHRTDLDGRTTIGIRSPVAPLLGGGYRIAVDRTAVAERLATDPPDVIELSDKTTLAGSVRRDPVRTTPVVMFSHERLDAIVARATRTTAFAPFVDRYNLRLADRADSVVCASRYSAAEFERIGVSVDHVPLGVDLSTFRPHPAEHRGPVRIVAVVRLSPEKRPELVVETSRALLRDGVDHELTVFGDGPLRSSLERRAVGLPVRFAGFVAERDRLAGALAAADVGIAPGPLETFGLAALELLASGTPVVVPAEGALCEIADGRVAVATERTPEAFAAEVRRLVTSDRRAIAAAARGLAERYDWERSVAAMLTVHERVLAGQPVNARTCTPRRGWSRVGSAGSDRPRSSTGAA